MNGSLGSGWVQHFAILHLQNDLLAGTSPRDAALNYVGLIRIAKMLSGLSDLIDPDTIGKFACEHLTTIVVSQNPRK